MRTKFLKIRRQRDQTITELAAEAQLSYGTIYSFEHGTLANPTRKTRHKLALAYGVPVERIMQAVAPAERGGE